jgi:hypothetical protein
MAGTPAAGIVSRRQPNIKGFTGPGHSYKYQASLSVSGCAPGVLHSAWYFGGQCLFSYPGAPCSLAWGGWFLNTCPHLLIFRQCLLKSSKALQRFEVSCTAAVHCLYKCSRKMNSPFTLCEQLPLSRHLEKNKR